MNHCCNWDSISADPCQALTDGDLDNKNYVNFGLSKAEFLLLTAQCGTTSAIISLEEVAEQILACCEASRLILLQIEENTDEIESKLDELIVLVTAGNADLSAILTAVQAILVEAEAINANTDQIEALLQSILTIVTAIGNNTDDLEACCAASNVLLQQIDTNLDQIEVLITAGNVDLAAIEVLITATNAQLNVIGILLTNMYATLTTILANQINPDLFGDHVYASGVGAIPAGQYSAWTVIRTDALGAVGTLTVEGLPLYSQGDSTGEEAQPQFKLTAPAIVAAGGATFAWRAIS